MRDLAARIGIARRRAGLHMSDLDELAGLTPGHIGLIESRKRKDPSIATVRAIAKALGVSIDWLANGTRASGMSMPRVIVARTGSDDD